MSDTLYEVYTVVDLSKAKLRYQSYSRDIAETVMLNMFRKDKCVVDYVLYNVKLNTGVSACLTQATAEGHKG